VDHRLPSACVHSTLERRERYGAPVRHLGQTARRQHSCYGRGIFGVVPPGDVARSRLSLEREASWVEAAFENQASLIAGIQYADLNGEQMSISEVEIRRVPSGEWRAGRSNLFRGDGSYPHDPYAFGGW